MGQTFNMTDLGRLVGGEWQLACGRWQVADKVGQRLTRKDDGLYLGDDGLVLPSVFTLEQFKAFCDWHPTFEWEAITSVFTNDDGTLDTGALEELDSRSAAAGVLVRCILGIADAEYLQAWEQQCAIDEVQTKIREITALKAMSISEIQYRDGRLKELSDELARLQQPAQDQTAATPAPVVVASNGPALLPAVPNWKMRVQAEATELFLRLLASGANPTPHSILDSMAQWCRDNEIKTATNINPSANYLRTHVLGGKHWPPPTMSREQAKKHVAQVAQTKVAQVAQ